MKLNYEGLRMTDWDSARSTRRRPTCRDDKWRLQFDKNRANLYNQPSDDGPNQPTGARGAMKRLMVMILSHTNLVIKLFI